MPWRLEGATPYRVWVSEIMLQQTQVQKVIPYFQKFMDRFPNVRALAEASESEVLGLWAGLGYYSRARNLHHSAKQCVALHGGELPRDKAGWQQLKGVGRYTTGAVRSIAYGEPEALVDGNVVRVIARRFALPVRRANPKDEALIWQRAEALMTLPVAIEAPGDVNQALMELGATLCSVAAPKCLVCPLRDTCEARQRGEQESYPLPKLATQKKRVQLAVAWVEQGERVLQVSRPQKGLWAGMWALPAVEGDVAALRTLLGDVVISEQPIALCDRQLTHRDVMLQLFSVAAKVVKVEQPTRWATPAQLNEMPQAFVELAKRRVLIGAQ